MLNILNLHECRCVIRLIILPIPDVPRLIEIFSLTYETAAIGANAMFDATINKSVCETINANNCHWLELLTSPLTNSL